VPAILCDISILRCTNASHLFHAVKVLHGPAALPLYAWKQIGMKTRRTRFTDLNGEARLGDAIRMQAGEPMFDFNKQTKIPDIFALINLRVAPSFKITSESMFSRGYIEQLLHLSGDVRTTVELALLAWESQRAERMAANATYDLIVREFIDFASKMAPMRRIGFAMRSMDKLKQQKPMERMSRECLTIEISSTVVRCGPLRPGRNPPCWPRGCYIECECLLRIKTSIV
jgi:hypothetical protein